MNNKIEIKRKHVFEIRIQWVWPFSKEQMLVQLQDLVFTFEDEIDEQKRRDEGRPNAQ